MLRGWVRKPQVALVMAVAVMVAASGLVTASNMGFKLNKQLYTSFGTTGFPFGRNLTSLSYNSPYKTARQLCDAVVGAGVSKAGVRVVTTSPAGVSNTTFCSTPAAPGHCLTPVVVAGCVMPAAPPPLSRAHEIDITCQFGTAACIAGPPASAVLVGSSDETVLLPGITGGNAFDNTSVAYHTTWVNARDVCVTYGQSVAGNPTKVIRIDALGGTFPTYFCSATATTGFSLIIGEGLQLQKSGAGVAGPLPPHF